MQKHHPGDEALALRFSHLMDKELKDLLSEVIFFGSAARAPHEKIYGQDVDVLVIFNDLIRVLNREVVEAYRIITENTAAKISNRLHITTMRLTNFWEYMQNGDPLAINIVRDGVPLLRRGLIEPFKKLLEEKKITPSKEMVWNYYLRGPMTVWSAKWHILQATIDLYWAVIDATHAALQSRGIVPVSPQHAALLLQKHLMKPGLVPKEYKVTLDKFYQIHQDIATRKIREITGKQYERYYAEAAGFVQAVEQILPKKT